MRAVNKKEAKTVNLTEVFELGKQIMIKNNDNVNSFLSTPDELYFLFVNYYTNYNQIITPMIITRR